MHTITKTLLALAIPAFAMAQNAPIDFETGGYGATWTWTVFENDTNPAVEIIPNPDQSGINTSATVAKFTALQAGQPWAGCETSHGAGTGSFVIDSSNYLIRIMVWKSEISDVGIKLVRPDSWSLGEIKVANTVTNQWEQLTFDFSAHIGLTPAYDQLVVFPDFNARTADEVIYFDNVFGGVASGVGIEESEINPVKIYPNPGTTQLRLESSNTIETVRVINLTGQLVMDKTVSGLHVDINTTDIPVGIYLIQVETVRGTEVLRWVKQD